MNLPIRILRLVSLAALTCQLLSATPVTIGDFSFEGNSLTTGGYSSNISPEWTGTNGSNDGSAFEEYISDFAADGTDHLGMVLNYDVWQDLGVTFQPNTRYTLTVAIGNRQGVTDTGNQSQYSLADSTGAVHATGTANASSVSPGSFANAPALVFDTPSAPAAVGRTVRILLQARGENRSHFDNIRLDATSLIPPGAATVATAPATEVTSTTANLHGQVTAIGNAAPVITLFWGTTQGGMVPANWQNQVTLAGTQTGAFSAAINGLVPNTTYHFTFRATNSAGDSWADAPGSLETPPLPPAVSTGAASRIGSTTATLGATVTDTGGETPAVTIYYGPTDGGTTPGNWAASVPLGALDSQSDAPVTGLTQTTPYYFRAYAQNSGGAAWASGSSSFTTLSIVAPQVKNTTPSGITGTTATLRGEVTDTGNDPPSITFFYGTTDGGTDPAAWTWSATVGVQSGDFTRFVAGLGTSTTYYFRCRAINPGGTSWAASSETFTTTALVSSVPVINEIHYHPDDDPTLGPVPLEFVELHNPGDTAVNLTNWKLADGITFTFPSGTTLNPGGYLVVAQDPPTLLSKYGVTALGPYSGKLSNSGETLELRDAANTLIDTVSYQQGFPWPTAADGAGSSMELINASLDNDLGGSWRSSSSPGTAEVTYIAPSSAGWKYKRGTAEPSSPVDAWRATAYNDAAWSTGTAPFGYGGSYIVSTPMNAAGAMQGKHRTVYYRKNFTIASNLPSQVTLRVRYDDAFVAWINGVEVKRNNAPNGQVAYNFSNTVSGHPATAWEDFTINTVVGGANILRGGTNVLCIHSLNESINSSDYYFDAGLIIPATGDVPNPTPNAANGNARPVNLVPPQVRQVSHSPQQPAANMPVTITTRITDPDGMGAVSLSYQIVNPGSYIRLTDLNYPTSWTSVPMLDNGTGGDAVAGDSVFTAVLPAAVQTHRRLVRYKITCADGLGNSQTVPYADDEQPNFAYFVYNGVPSWTGTLRPGSPAVTYPVAALPNVQTYQLIANAADVNNSQYSGSYNGDRFRGTIVYDGIVYDHVEFKNRGIGSTYQSGKNKWNIFFNRTRDLVARDNWGKKYAETWNNLILNANATPWAPVNRGAAGVEEASSARIFELAGNTNFRTHYVHWRVIDDAAESSPTDQYTGDLWGLYLAVEPTEGNFLDERGLPDGNVYAIEGNGGDKKHQGENQPVDSSDWDTFSTNLTASGQTEAWYRANMDLDKLYTFLAINRLIGNVDVRPGDNYRYYHRSSDNKWEILGYDFDMQFLPAHHWGGTMDGVVVAGQPNSIRAIMRHPALAREYRNRCRELLDLLAADASAKGGQIGQLLNEYASLVSPAGQTVTWANLDAAMWNLNPHSTGGHYGNFFRASMTDSRGGLGGTVNTDSWLRTLADTDGDGFSDFPNRVKWFVDFSTNTYPANAAPWVRKATNTAGGGTDTDVNRQKGYGYKYLEWESLYGGYANANVEPTIPAKTDYPNTPTLAATGDPAFPTSDLKFTSSAFSAPSGAGAFAAWQWRIAEISAPGVPGYDSGKPCKYEITALFTSAALTTTPGNFSIPLGLAETGKTYRVRVRHKDANGNWGHWSAPAQFVTTAPDVQLVHYWNFNTTASLLTPTRTTGGGGITVSGTWVSDTGQEFNASNSRLGDPAGAHLRVNNPIGQTVGVLVPTTGFEDIIIRYETRRSGQGAGTQFVSYTLDGTNFVPFATFTTVNSVPEIKILDFRDLPAADNNPAFALRITFDAGAGGTEGNNRFDNLTVEGKALPPSYGNWRIASFTNPSDRTNDAISGPHANPSGDGVENLIRYALGVGPYDPVTGLLPALWTNGGSHDFRFRYDATKSDLIWRVKGSDDLTTWSSVLFDSQTSVIPPLDDGWLTVTLPDFLGSGPEKDSKMFTRLEVELTTP